MKNSFVNRLTILVVCLFISFQIFAQNSVLVNLGSGSCTTTTPGFFLIKDPLSAVPATIAGCDLSTQLPDFYNTFVAFNPTNSKIYITDTRTGVSKIWVMDMSLPGSISCPLSIPAEPDFVYNYVPNNFEFDPNGKLWSFAGYNDTTGTCSIDNFDLNTGTIISSRTLQFPEGNFPGRITTGDICILPNGRMFAVLGSPTSSLYEITGYNSSDTAKAAFLQSLPKTCFGIAYLNGSLELTGFNTLGCFYYQYNISDNTVLPEQSFQAGQLPIDNTSFSPSIGAAKQLTDVHASGNDVNLSYNIYVKNMGNTILNNVNITEDLQNAFAPATISNLAVEFLDNPASLQLNPQFDGVNETKMLADNQQLPNNNALHSDYYFKVKVSFTVSNADKEKIYFNSAIGTATINNEVDPIYISDSSNNGDELAVDPDNDGNASGINENIPTPFSFSLLPVRFIDIAATLTGKGTAIINWSVGTPAGNASFFEAQYSVDGIAFKSFAKIKITNNAQANYSAEHLQVPAGMVNYRVRETDQDGKSMNSKIVALDRKTGNVNFVIFPNPASNIVSITMTANLHNAKATIYDNTGRKLQQININSTRTNIDFTRFPKGSYTIHISDGKETVTRQIIITH